MKSIFPAGDYFLSGNEAIAEAIAAQLFCPDLAITRNEEIEVDYDYCKGCGICALVYPKGAIEMVVAVE